MLNLHRMCTRWKDYQTRKLCVLQALDLSDFPHHRFTVFQLTRGVHASAIRIQILCIYVIKLSFKYGAGEGWRRSVGIIVQKIKNYCMQARRQETSYIQ